jgi:pyridoxal phosphate enzyme (YggS family)
MTIAATTDATVSALQQRLQRVRDRIASIKQDAGPAPGGVTLVGVSKTVGRDVIDAAYAAGLRDFGENRVQDARDKFTDAPADARLHLIGSLQTNKARMVIGLAHLIHSVDRVALVDALQERAAATDIVQPILLQINIAREEQKHGCLAEDAEALLEHVLASSNLQLRGFMTMAPLVSTPEEARPVFAGLRELRDKLQTSYPNVDLSELSMGMSNDYAVAIEEGATIVRVGRAIFAEPAGASA